MGQKATEPARIERTGEKSMVVEHDDGSKFDCNFGGGFPTKAAMSRVKRSKCFGTGSGPGKGAIKKMRDRLGYNDKFYTDPEHPDYIPGYVPVDERKEK